MINKVIATGNLTRDPELRVTATGTPVLGFGIAINERRKNAQTQQWEDYPNFVDCTMFGARAESVSKYLSKGMKVAIEGKLHWSQWERDGQKRSKIEVFVEEIDFMYGSKNQSQNQMQNAPAQLPQTQQVTVHNATSQNAYQQAPQSASLPQSQTPAYMAAPQPAQIAPQGSRMPQQQPLQNSIYDEDIPF